MQPITKRQLYAGKLSLTSGGKACKVSDRWLPNVGGTGSKRRQRACMQCIYIYSAKVQQCDLHMCAGHPYARIAWRIPRSALKSHLSALWRRRRSGCHHGHNHERGHVSEGERATMDVSTAAPASRSTGRIPCTHWNASRGPIQLCVCMHGRHLAAWSCTEHTSSYSIASWA
jgi:hypothetical protein